VSDHLTNDLEEFEYLICLDLLNDTYACENDKVLNDIVKREYGFRGCEHYNLFTSSRV
jgi:hypothetical protein